MKPIVCLHCRKNRATRPRGLCWSCYYTPGVKERYGSKHKANRTGPSAQAGPLPLPAVPTYTDPGSEERIRVMMARVARGEQCFHPADTTAFAESWLGRSGGGTHTSREREDSRGA